MVDIGLQEQGRLFTANDCAVGGEESVILITGYAACLITLFVILIFCTGLTWQEKVPI